MASTYELQLDAEKRTENRRRSAPRRDHGMTIFALFVTFVVAHEEALLFWP
jgi:hypothetical protein